MPDRRASVGAGFAMIDAAVILVTLVRRLRFTPLAGHKPQPVARVTLRPAGGMPLLIPTR
jgi:cytochrome P450